MSQGLLITGVILAVLGIALALAGRSGERGYWIQRDPTETAGQDDVTLAQVAQHLGDNAVRGKRPSLRIMAIGLIMVIAGVICGVVGWVLSLTG